MHRRLLHPLMVTVLAVGLAAAGSRPALAVLAHRYSFTGNLNDTVGTAHGTMVDVGAPTAAFNLGQLDLSANTGQGSNGITEDAYVDLPNNLITDMTGPTGAFSIELWATVSAQHTWQRYVDFGTSDGGENMSGGGGNSPYIYIAPNSGRFNNGLATEAHQPNGAATEVGVAGPFNIGAQQHVVATYDQNDLTSGANGTFKLYLNGALIGANALPPALNLKTFTNNNNWFGRSQWPDSVFDGLYNEIRLYDNALTASQVGADSILGPDTLTGSILNLEVNKNTGAVKLTNATSQTLNFDFYRISSAGNALNKTSWNSLDDQNFAAIDSVADVGTVAGDSPGEGFDEVGGSNAGQLAELFLGSAGAAITAGQSLNLGNAFNTSIFGAGNNGDLAMTFGLVGGIQIAGTVTYVTSSGTPGDLNTDGKVDGLDFLAWQRGFGTTYNATDLANIKANYGAGGATAAAGAVPEPATAGLLLVAVVGLAAASRKRNS